MDLRMTTFIASLDMARYHSDGRLRSLFVRFLSRALLVETGQYAHGHALKSIREVVDDVPSIGNLHGSWSTAPRRTGVHTISIATDNFRSGVFG